MQQQEPKAYEGAVKEDLQVIGVEADQQSVVSLVKEGLRGQTFSSFSHMEERGLTVLAVSMTPV